MSSQATLIAYWLTVCLSQNNVMINQTTDVILIDVKEYTSNTTNGDLGCAISTYVDPFNSNTPYHFLSQLISISVDPKSDSNDTYQMVTNVYDNKFNQYNKSNNEISKFLPFLGPFGIVPDDMNFAQCTNPITNDIILCYYSSRIKENYFTCRILFNNDSSWSVEPFYSPFDVNYPQWQIIYLSLLCLDNGHYLIFTNYLSYQYNVYDTNGTLVEHEIIDFKNLTMDDNLFCNVGLVSSFDLSFLFLCTISSVDQDKNCTLNYIVGEYNMENSKILIDNTIHEITVNTSFGSETKLPNYCMSNVYVSISPFGYGPIPLVTGCDPISISVTNDCCYIIPYIMQFADADWLNNYNYSYWFTIMDKNGNNVLNDQDVDVLVRTQWKEEDITPQIEAIDLSMLNNNGEYYFMIIYTYVDVKTHNISPPASPQSIIGQVYSLKYNANYSLSLLKEITFIDSLIPPIFDGFDYMANQFCVNVLDKQENIFSLTWTSMESQNYDTPFQYVYGQSWQIHID